MYFWDKYTSQANYSTVTTYTEGAWGAWSGVFTKASNVAWYGYPSYGFRSSSGFYLNGSRTAYYTSANYFEGGSNSITETRIYSNYMVNGKEFSDYQHRTKSASSTTEEVISGYSAGTFIETLIADKNAYSSHAQNTDGYYYIRRQPVPPKVVYPNGGEAITGPQTITWDGETTLAYEIQLSTDNGARWKTLIANTTVGATTFEHNFTNESQTSLAKIRIRATDNGIYSSYDESDGVFTIQHNLPPLAPSKLAPNGTVIDRTKVKRFSWQHNDPNTNDTQSSAVIEWKTQGATTWNTITVSGNNQYHDVSANVFSAAEIVWRVKTFDQAGLESPISAEAIFTAADPSDAPVILTPSTVVPIAQPTVQWSSGAQTAYQIVIDDILGATVWDSGEVLSGNKARTIGVELVNGGQYVLKVRIRNGAGLWTDNAILQMTVSYTQPAKPGLSVMPGTGGLVLEIDNPTPTGTQPDVTGNDIYKRIDGEWMKIAEDVLAVYRDYAVASGKEYEYKVRAKGENTTFSESAVVSGSHRFIGVWLHDVTYPEGTVHQFKFDGDGRSSSWEVESAVQYFKGRKYPVVETGEMQTEAVAFSLKLIESDEIEALKALVYGRNILCYRDGRGRMVFGMITKLPLNDETWGGQATSLELLRIDYKEGV